MGATLWLVLVAAGFGFLFLVGPIKWGWAKAVFVRAAALSFAGAGTVGAAGWIGTSITWCVDTVNSLAASLGAAALGTGAIWVVWLGLLFAWCLTILPESIFSKPMPDWLSMSGIVLPSLAASVPGPLGAAMRDIVTALGSWMASMVAGWVGL